MGVCEECHGDEEHQVNEEEQEVDAGDEMNETRRVRYEMGEMHEEGQVPQHQACRPVDFACYLILLPADLCYRARFISKHRCHLTIPTYVYMHTDSCIHTT